MADDGASEDVPSPSAAANSSPPRGGGVEDGEQGEGMSRSRRDRSRSRSRSHERKKRRRRDRERDRDRDRHRRKERRRKKEDRSRGKRKRSKKGRRKSRSPSSSSSSSSSGGGSSPSASDGKATSDGATKTRKVANERLLAKLSARGETLEEREERRAARRAARIADRFGYTAEDNPFNDPDIAETFTWRKREEKRKPGAANAGGEGTRRSKQDHIISEIDKVRQRRADREAHFEEMERIRAEESRMKELEHYDEWARKEEDFHLQQQRQRSAIRLVEGRERPVDVLAKNLLLFGLTEEEKKNRAAVKYREKYNALDELETLEAELEEPHDFLRDLKVDELQELLADINAFRILERESAVAAAREGGGSTVGRKVDNPVLQFWDALHRVTEEEIKYVNSGGEDGRHASVVGDIQKMFEGQSAVALDQMREEIQAKIRSGAAADAVGGGLADSGYWGTVLGQLDVHLAKMVLSDLHSKMLVRQLEKLERRKDELAEASEEAKTVNTKEEALERAEGEVAAASAAAVPKNVDPDFGNLEEELGLASEVDVPAGGSYAWQERFRPRKPRYFNRVKTGYDWNTYNKTHYDPDNPPPKSVQGYKFSVFYPDLMDRTKTPQFTLERTESPDFVIIRFKAGPPYEDVAFKIVNREWNRARKHGYRCTFERGVLSLYFNFKGHWYRR